MILNNKTNLLKLIRLIKFSLQTKKTINLEKLKKYTFLVNKCLKKSEIKYIFEIFFNFKIQKIQTLNISKKKNFKKIYITLKKDKNFYFNSFYTSSSLLWQ